MSPHPCSGHLSSCDHCPTCEGLDGHRPRCSATVPSAAKIVALSLTSDADLLRQAIGEDQATRLSLADLLHSEIASTAIREELAEPPEVRREPVPLALNPVNDHIVMPTVTVITDPQPQPIKERKDDSGCSHSKH